MLPLWSRLKSEDKTSEIDLPVRIKPVKTF